MEVFLTIGALVLIEGLLSFDNALVLAALVKHLHDQEQKKALTYGIVGAFVFRILSLTLLTLLMQSMWVKLIGGVYLFILAIKHFFFENEEEQLDNFKPYSFWKTVLVVELTDIMFSIDSIMASVALSQKLWIVVVGGLLGILMMRFVAGIFVELIHKFPNLERTGYLLVLLVGTKLLVSTTYDCEATLPTIAFWGCFGLSVISGFFPQILKESTQQ